MAANETKVVQNYTSPQNISVTVKNGRISKVTLWTSGNTAKETKRITADNV